MPSYYAESTVNPLLKALTDKPQYFCDLAIACGVDESCIDVTLEYLSAELGVPLVIEGERAWINPRDLKAFRLKLPEWIRESNRRLSA